MSYDVITILPFLKAAKRLAKKYPSLRSEIEILSKDLEENPHKGEPIGRNCYKIRLAISSKGKGKSGGARVITCVILISRKVYLLSIYDKSEQADLTAKEMKALLEIINHRTL